MALQRNRNKFTAADVGPANFYRRKARIETKDAQGEVTGHANVVQTSLEVGFVVEQDAELNEELHIFDVASVLPADRRRAMLLAAWQELSAAEKQAVLDAAWADFLETHKLTEV